MRSPWIVPVRMAVNGRVIPRPPAGARGIWTLGRPSRVMARRFQIPRYAPLRGASLGMTHSLALVLCLLAGCTVRRAGETQPPAKAPEPTRTEAAPVEVAAKPPEAWTLDECIRQALSNNRAIRIADRRVLIAQDVVGEAWSAVLPKVGADVRYQTRSNNPGANLGGSSMITGERASETARVSLLVPLYDFGGSRSLLKVEELRVEASDLGAERARQVIAFSVSQAYFRVLEARKIESVVQDSIGVLERQLAVSRDFLSQGLVARNDLLAVEVQLAERRQDLIRAQSNVELAMAVLNRLMGLEVTRPTAIVDVLEAVPWSGTFESVFRLALSKRADLKVLDRQIEIARAQYRATGVSFLPRFFAFADYNWNSDKFLRNDDWLSGGVGIQWSLFDGLGTVHRLRRNQREIEEAGDLRDEKVDDIVLELRQAYLGVRDSAARIPVASKSIEGAEENLRVIRDQYAQGLVSSADVLTEEDRLSRARSARFRALYDYHTAYARLTHAIGDVPPSQ